MTIEQIEYRMSQISDYLRHRADLSKMISSNEIALTRRLNLWSRICVIVGITIGNSRNCCYCFYFVSIRFGNIYFTERCFEIYRKLDLLFFDRIDRFISLFFHLKISSINTD